MSDALKGDKIVSYVTDAVQFNYLSLLIARNNIISKKTILCEARQYCIDTYTCITYTADFRYLKNRYLKVPLISKKLFGKFSLFLYISAPVMSEIYHGLCASTDR